MPILNNSWFELHEDSNDLNNVIRFIETLPDNLKELCKHESFIDLLDNDFKRYRINYFLFNEAFEEARDILNFDLQILKIQISDNNNQRMETLETFNEILDRIGFSGSSLKLKAGLINKLWDSVIAAGNGIITFASNPVVKALRKFLSYLNSLLGSLKELLPGIDAIKEIKEVIESYLGMADE
jgi:hypothetical protein